MKMTSFGMFGLLCFLIYYLFLSVKLILIGLGKIENPKTKKTEINKRLLISGIIAGTVTLPFFCFIVYFFIQVFVLVYASAEDVDKIKEEMECIGLNYIPVGKKITVEVLLRNNSDRVLGIPYRSFERYEEYDGKTLIIKTFTEKELKGDFSLRAHDDGILYDDLKAVNSYTLLTEVKPADCVVLFFSFDFDAVEQFHNTVLKEIVEYDQIFIEFLYADFTVSFDSYKTYVSTIPVKRTAGFTIQSFDTYSYIDSWEKSMVLINDRL